jgi:hypothetical protein
MTAKNDQTRRKPQEYSIGNLPPQMVFTPAGAQNTAATAFPTPGQTQTAIDPNNPPGGGGG